LLLFGAWWTGLALMLPGAGEVPLLFGAWLTGLALMLPGAAEVPPVAADVPAAVA
jgi:hypothetical protein